MQELHSPSVHRPRSALVRGPDPAGCSRGSGIGVRKVCNTQRVYSHAFHFLRGAASWRRARLVGAAAGLMVVGVAAGPATCWGAMPSAGWGVKDFATSFLSSAPAPSGVGPIGLTFDAGGSLLVGDGPDGFVYRFGTGGGVADSGHRVNATSVPGVLTGLAFGKDGRLYAGRNSGGDVVEIDPGTGAIVRTVIAGLGQVRALAVDPLSGDLFVTSAGSSLIRVANPASLAPVASVYAPMHDPDGLTIGADATMYVVDFPAAGGAASVVRVAGTNSPVPGAKVTIATVPGADGVAVGANPVDHSKPPYLAVNRTDGKVTLIDLTQSPASESDIVTGGSRGDFSTVGADGCLYATQTDRVLKVTAADGRCPFGHRFDPVSAFLPPTVATTQATGISADRATLTGTVNPNGTPTGAHFEYGPGPTYGQVTADLPLPTPTVAQAVTAGVTGLSVCTLYHYRIVAESAGGTSYGQDQTFASQCPPPANTLAPPPAIPQPATPPGACPAGPVTHRQRTRAVGAAHATVAAARRPGGGRPRTPAASHRPQVRLPARPILLTPRAGGHVRAGNVLFRWRPAARARRYMLIVDRHEMKAGGCTSAVMRIKHGHHKWRVIAVGQAGKSSSKTLAFIASDLAQQIAQRAYVDQGLEELSRYVNDAGNYLKPVGTPAAGLLLGSLGKVAKAIGKSSVLGVVVALITAESLSCYDQPQTRSAVNDRARSAFLAARLALRAASRARQGATQGPRSRLVAARNALSGLGFYLDIFLSSNSEECSAYAKVAQHALDATYPAVRNALHYLDSIDQAERDTALHAAQNIDRRPKVGRVRCENAGTLSGRFGGTGPGKNNYVVYWAPPPASPPGDNVRYVGISRSLKRRCQDHSNDRSGNLETLNLPPLSRQEALAVEEALIAHFGPGPDDRNGAPPNTARGQLRNLIHAVSTRRSDYCVQLLAGQSLLVLNPRYAPYTVAFYTRDRACVGVGGSR